MKTAPNGDLQGRIIICTQMATLISETLEAFGQSEDEKSPCSFTALGSVAEELAEELLSIEKAYVGEANERGIPEGAR